MEKLLILSLIIITFSSVQAQQDSVRIERDTIVIQAQDSTLIKSYAERYNPRKALLFAAIVPGLGQIYNKKYWKLPLVYGGFYLLGRQVAHDNNIFKTYKAHLFYNLEHNLTADAAINPQTKFTTSQLRRIVDLARRERDFMIILMGGMYLLQIIDAHVDAHLKEFDLNPNLHARIEPKFSKDAFGRNQSGMSLIFRF